jgi:hypothetical protein
MMMMMRLNSLLLLLLTFEAFQLGFGFVCKHKITANVVSSIGGRRDTTALSTTAIPYVKTTPVSEELVNKFQTFRKAFPNHADIVKAGGWYNVQRLSVDPKQEFVSLIVEGLKSTRDNKVQFGKIYAEHDNEKLEALLLLLYAMGKGFVADTINGEWDLVFSKQGEKSPAFQKLVGSNEKAGTSKNFFDVATMTFSGIVKFWKWGIIGTKVKVGWQQR